jgi:hypothetical protein
MIDSPRLMQMNEPSGYGTQTGESIFNKNTKNFIPVMDEQSILFVI